jgi:hypothetical protein
VWVVLADIIWGNSVYITVIDQAPGGIIISQTAMKGLTNLPEVVDAQVMQVETSYCP